MDDKLRNSMTDEVPEIHIEDIEDHESIQDPSQKHATDQHGFSIVKTTCKGNHVLVRYLQDYEAQDDKYRYFLSQARIMSHLRHPNIELLMGVVRNDSIVALVTHYDPKSLTLQQVLDDPEDSSTLYQRLKWGIDYVIGTIDADIGYSYL
eukprot:TRINITY_DN6062_c0_g1_i2.p1 TRINITY_DN6062_c0_g1~~TRINITY_DN6062_c0_g1_i2.p1  ORF type:complete len:159 (-),score=23.65 TRINITY_DN6062_c0_g1_i2:78-527(-)